MTALHAVEPHVDEEVEYLTTREVAEKFRTSPSTVNEWRQKGVGPLGVRFGKNVLYPVAEVTRWEAERTADAVRERDRIRRAAD